MFFWCFFLIQKHGLTCGRFIPLHLSTDVFEFWTLIRRNVNRKFTIYAAIAFSAILFLPTPFGNLAQIILPFTYLPRILKNRGTFGALFTICSYDFVYTHKSAHRFLHTMTKALVKTLFIPYRIFTRQYYSKSRVQGCKTGITSVLLLHWLSAHKKS